jgi:hypothetical protein
MRTIAFADGQRMPWMTYRAMMNNEISPFKAVAASRRDAAAYDQALRRGARDQSAIPVSSTLDDKRRRARDQGTLTPEFCNATRQYLTAAGLPEEDVEAVAQIIGKYAGEMPAEDSETLEMPEAKRISVGPRGQIGASDRRFALDALDQHGRPRDPDVSGWCEPRVRRKISPSHQDPGSRLSEAPLPGRGEGGRFLPRTPVSERSPERARLAAEIEKLSGLEVQLKRLAEARERLDLRGKERAASAARHALDEARKRAPEVLVAKMMG